MIKQFLFINFVIFSLSPVDASQKDIKKILKGLKKNTQILNEIKDAVTDIDDDVDTPLEGRFHEYV